MKKKVAPGGNRSQDLSITGWGLGKWVSFPNLDNLPFFPTVALCHPIMSTLTKSILIPLTIDKNISIVILDKGFR